MNEQVFTARQGAPTIADVARLAGVSTMTVSRVMNGRGRVREDTRQTVNAAISALNYTPSSAARSLAGISTIRIGLLCSKPSSYLGELLLGSLEQAGRIDAQLIVEKCQIGAHEADVAR
ncbi:MAG: helix-turn-helix transcriptional regulator, partial [Sphingomonas bacterium]